MLEDVDGDADKELDGLTDPLLTFETDELYDAETVGDVQNVADGV